MLFKRSVQFTCQFLLKMWNKTLKLRRPPGESLVYRVHARTCSTPDLEDSLCLNIPWRTQIIYKVKASAATCLTGSPGSFYETWKQAAIVRKRGCAEEEKKKQQDSPVMFARSEGRLWSRCLIRSPSSAVARLLLRKGNTACFSNVCLCKYDDGKIFLFFKFLCIIFATCSGWTRIFLNAHLHITQHIPSLFKSLVPHL